MSAPLVSVAVIAHNQASYVRECLDSVVASSVRDLGIVIVDDGSTDGTHEEIESWLREHRDLPVDHLRHQQSLGVGRALNDAMELCRGEFLTGLAADDLLLPDGIAERIAYLQAHPEKLAVFADAHVIDRNGARLFESAIEDHYARFGTSRRDLASDELLPYALVFHWGVPGPVFLCRRTTFDVVGRYDESLVTEDWDMYLRLAAIGKLGFLDRYVGSYRQHDDSMTRRQHDRMVADAARASLRLSRQFRGSLRYRLRAQHDLWVSRHSRSPWTKAGYWTLARAESLVACTGYLARRMASRKRTAVADRS